MPPKSKTKAKKSKGVDTAPTKQSNKASKRAQSPTFLQQNLVVTEEEFKGDAAITAPLQGMADCMDKMMAMILELSQKVHGQDKAATGQMGNESVKILARKKEGQTSGLPYHGSGLRRDGTPEGRAKIEAGSPGRRDHISRGQLERGGADHKKEGKDPQVRYGLYRCHFGV